MLQGNSTPKKVTRFRILALLSAADGGLTCKELAKVTEHERYITRSFQASLATRLRRLRRWGLVRRRLDKFDRPKRSRRKGVSRWRLSRRGSTRLSWAKSRGLV